MIVPHFDNLQIHLHYSGNNLQKLPYVAYLGFWCTKIMEAKAHLLQPTQQWYKIPSVMLTFEVGCPGCLLSVTTCCWCVGRFRRDGCSIEGQRIARWSSNAEPGSEPDPLPPRLTIEHQNWFSTALYIFIIASFATTGQQTRRTYINEVW